MSIFVSIVLLKHVFFLGKSHSPITLKVSHTCISSESGERLYLDCRVVGYPVPIIYWSKVRVVLSGTCTYYMYGPKVGVQGCVTVSGFFRGLQISQFFSDL